MKRSILCIIPMLCLLLTVCNACWAKDTLVLAIGGESTEGYDPTRGWGQYGNSLFQSTLLRRDAQLNIIGDLATSWRLSADRLSWTITLRPNVRFSDGKPLTADDVVFTFATAARTAGEADLTAMAKATATNPTTVVITLKNPDITFINNLITLGIVPKHLYGPDYARHPVGSGPYKFVQWDEGQQLIVEANEQYYGGAPAIKRLVFLFTEEDASFAAAQTGKIDVLSVPSSLARQKIAGMQLHPVKSVDNRGLMFPMLKNEGKTTPAGLPIGNDVTADPAIRKAVNFAINRQALVDGVLEGYGSPAYGVADNLPWDNAGIRIQDNNQAKAIKILADAGWKDTDGDGIAEKNGLKATFTIAYNSKDSLRQGLALAVADMLKPVGILAKVEGHSWDEIKTQLTHANVVVYGFGDHSPAEMLKLYRTPGPEPMYWNAGFYSNPTVDANFMQALAAPDFQSALEYWKKAQWDGTTGFGIPGDAAWAWMVNLEHTYFVSTCLDIGQSQMEPHGHGWPITANIHEWKWTCK